MYDSFLRDKVYQKLSKFHKTSDEKSTSQESKITLSHVYQQYLEHCTLQNFTKPTLQSKKRLLKIFKHNKIAYPDDFDQHALNKLFETWKQTPKDTLRKHIANIKAFLNYCIKRKLFKRDAYEALTFPNPKVNVRETVISEPDYLLLLQNAQDEDFKLYLQTLWETGCRPNEIVCLKKPDIDFEKGTAKIFQSKTQKYKTVYFTDELLEKLKNTTREWIFQGCGRQKEYYAKKFKDLKEKLRLPKGYCLYAFRHSFATRMLNKTKDLHLVSRLLGHSDIQITAKHYINRSDDDIRKQLLEVKK